MTGEQRVDGTNIGADAVLLAAGKRGGADVL
jgi:hypothetical protein